MSVKSITPLAAFGHCAVVTGPAALEAWCDLHGEILEEVRRDTGADAFHLVRPIRHHDGFAGRAILCRSASELRRALEAVPTGWHAYATVHPHVLRDGSPVPFRLVGISFDLDGKAFGETWREGLERIAALTEDRLTGPRRPSALWYTGRGVQGLVLFHEALDPEDQADLAAFAAASAAIVADLGADTQACGRPAQLTRPAGTVNPKEAPGLPTALLYIDGDRRLDPSEVHEWFGPAPKAAAATEGRPRRPVAFTRDPDVIAAIRAAGWAYRTKAHRTPDGRVIDHFVLTGPCPACGGGRRRRPATASVSVVGRLRCLRESCPTNAETWSPAGRDNATYLLALDRGGPEAGGLPLRVWASAYAPEILPVLDRRRLAGSWPTPVVHEAREVHEPADVLAALEEAETWSRENRGVAVISGPTGLGKTREALGAVVKGRLQRPALFLSSHAAVGEKEDELAAIAAEAGVAVSVSRYLGIQHGCHFAAAFRAFGDAAQWRRSACKGCPEVEECPVGRPDFGADLLTGAHAALPVLAGTKDRPLTGRTVIVDERPAPVAVAAYSLADLEVLQSVGERERIAGRGAKLRAARMKALRAANAAIALMKAAVADHVEAAATDQARRRFGSMYKGSELAARVAKLSADDLKALEAGSTLSPRDVPALNGEKLRAGEYKAGDVVRPDLGKAFRGLLAAGSPKASGDFATVTVRDAATGPEVVLTLWSVTPLHVPADGALIVLDATGGFDLETYRALAGGAPVRVLSLTREPHPEAKVERLLVASKSVSRSALLSAGELTERGARRLHRLLAGSLAAARRRLGELDRPVRVGLITYKAVADLLNRDPDDLVAELVADPASPILTEDQAETLEVVLLCRWWAGLANEGVEALAVGHYGRDERATNAYRESDVLLTVGHPVANLRALEVELTMLQARGFVGELADLVKARTAGDLVQAEGRARASSRGDRVVLVSVGPVAPPSWAEAGFDHVVALTDEDALREDRDLILDDAVATVWTDSGVVVPSLLAKVLETVRLPRGLIVDSPIRHRGKRSSFNDLRETLPDRTFARALTAALQRFGLVQVLVGAASGGSSVAWVRPEDEAEARRLVAGVRGRLAAAEAERERLEAARLEALAAAEAETFTHEWRRVAVGEVEGLGPAGPTLGGDPASWPAVPRSRYLDLVAAGYKTTAAVEVVRRGLLPARQ